MKKIGKTVAVTLVICILFILVKNEYGRLLLSTANYGMPALIKESREEKNGGIDLFVGSSMFGRGLDINELYGRLGGNEYLLTCDGNQPFLEYYEIRYLIDAGVDIGHVYIDMYAFTAARRPWLSDERLLLQTDLQFKKNIWDEMYHSANAGIKDFWELFVTSNNEAVLTWPFYQPLVDRSMFRGGNLRRNKGVTAEELKKMDMPESSSETILPKQREYLIRLIELCREEEIPVIFLETPKYQELTGQVNYMAIMEDYISLLKEYQVAFYLSEATNRKLEQRGREELMCGAGFVIPFDSADPGMFSDYIHLSADGKKTYTQNLVMALGKNR